MQINADGTAKVTEYVITLDIVYYRSLFYSTAGDALLDGRLAKYGF